MTSNFALSLSFEGIRLMHRVPGGWHLVGEVALESDDLTADLADLRDKGLMLEPDGMRTKLLIPDSQIKYHAIDSAQTSDDDVRAAMDGTTPYALADLAIDFDRTGGRTYIAAVARETLDEAEAFAADHQFAPIAFAAIPEPLTFRSEVFFGPTKAADTITGGVPVTRDDKAVEVIGQADFGAIDNGPRIPGFMAGAAKAIGATSGTDDPGGDDPAGDGLAGNSDAANPADNEPEVVFASRARGEAAQAETRKQPPALAVPVGPTDGPAIDVTTDDTAPEGASLSAIQPRVADAPAVTGHPDPTPSFSTRRTPEVVVPVVASAPVVPVVDAPPEPVAAPDPARADKTANMAPFGAAAGRVGGKPKYLGLMLTAGLLVFLFLVALWANTLSEDGIAGWFRSDPDTQIADAPGTDDVVISAAPQIATQPLVEETPAPSALAPETVVPDVSEGQQPLPIVRAPTGRVLSPAEADRIYAATGVYQRAPRLPLTPRDSTLEGFVESRPLPVSVLPDQLFMPQRDPMLPDAGLPPQRNPPAAGVVFQRDLRGFILATPDGTLTPDGALVFSGRPEIAPPSRPGSEQVVAVSAPAVSPQSRSSDTGVILVSGRPPVVPPSRPEGLAPDEALAPPQADPATPSDDTDPTDIAQSPDQPDPAVVAEVIANLPSVATTIEPSSLAFLSPETTLEDPEQTTIPDGATASSQVRVASGWPNTRPNLRPDGLVPAPALDVFEADPALAGYRPALRPESLAPATQQDEPETQEPDLNAVIAAIADAAPPSAFRNVTARAIAASPRPDTRPRNFAQVVARAQAAAARQQPSVQASAPQTQQPAVAASAAPVAPTGPIPGSVAQAATVDNAIRLRDMNLIGVYGRPNARRALVRLGNGRYVKVEVGSSLDGGQVTAIGDSALNFVKRGRTYALQLPQG